MFAPAKADARRRGDPAALPVYFPARFDGRRGSIALPEVKPLRAGNAPAGIRISPRVPLNDAAGYHARFAAHVQRFPARFEEDVSTDFRSGERNHRPPR